MTEHVLILNLRVFVEKRGGEHVVSIPALDIVERHEDVLVAVTRAEQCARDLAESAEDRARFRAEVRQHPGAFWDNLASVPAGPTQVACIDFQVRNLVRHGMWEEAEEALASFDVSALHPDTAAYAAKTAGQFGTALTMRFKDRVRRHLQKTEK